MRLRAMDFSSKIKEGETTNDPSFDNWRAFRVECEARVRLWSGQLRV
jgi:hypothetical protein